MKRKTESEVSCSYLTIYSGDKLPSKYNDNVYPLFYIGSTYFELYEQGYCGSVCSKQYNEIWNSELKKHPEFFDVIILNIFETRKEATIDELKYQKENDVVKNPLFINKSFATIDGYFGMNTSGENHPRFNKEVSEETRAKHRVAQLGEKHKMFGKNRTLEENDKNRLGNSHSPFFLNEIFFNNREEAALYFNLNSSQIKYIKNKQRNKVSYQITKGKLCK